jgi:hypothetical protein
MHLTKDPAAFDHLICYYQFNEASGVALDKVGVRHGSLVGPTIKREKSTAPVGKGVSQRLNVAAGKKRYTFGSTGLTLVFPTAATFPNGEVVVSRLYVSPDTLPNATTGASDYWIVQNYGSNTQFTAPNQIWFDHIGAMPADLTANACKVWRREPVAHGPLWQYLDSADELSEGPNASLGFTASNQLKSAGQFWLELPGLSELRPALTASVLVADPDFRVFPSPVAEGGWVVLRAATLDKCTFFLFDTKGQQVRATNFTGSGALNTGGLAAGVYTYRIESGGYMRFGRLVVVP